MGEQRNAGFWWKKLKERDHYEDLDIQSMIILRCKTQRNRMGGCQLDSSGSG